MEKIRKPFQGVLNIIRFNWHFYAIGLGLVLTLLLFAQKGNASIRFYIYLGCVLVSVPVLISLIVSFYVYDISKLYDFEWIATLDIHKTAKIVNINAGFDETSILLKKKISNVELIVLDFYNPLKHTEISIKRARKAYPPYPETQHIKTKKIPLASNSIDSIFVILAAHEIRTKEERKLFFDELNRVTKSNGRIIIIEHLRDFTNFLAYTLGFFHFHSKKTWLTTFSSSGLTVVEEIKNTPFITIFILKKNGHTS